MTGSLQQAHDDLYAALNAMLTGDSGPMREVWSQRAEITNADPFGGLQAGSESVRAEFDRVAAMRLGGSITPTEVRMMAGTDMGITTCREIGRDHKIDGGLVSLAHRATNVFRREAEGWKLVHHHTDGSASEDLAAMREMNAGLRATLDLVDAFAYTKDRAGRYVYANKKVRELFGRPLEEIRGKDDSHFFDLALSNELKANDARVMEQDITFEREERNIIKATGEERIYWTVKSPVHDDPGRVVGMCGISTDISGRARAE